MPRKISRKDFLKMSLAGLAGLFLGSKLFKGGGEASAAPSVPAVFNGRVKKGIKGDYDLVVA